MANTKLQFLANVQPASGAFLIFSGNYTTPEGEPDGIQAATSLAGNQANLDGQFGSGNTILSGIDGSNNWDLEGGLVIEFTGAYANSNIPPIGYDAASVDYALTIPTSVTYISGYVMGSSGTPPQVVASLNDIPTVGFVTLLCNSQPANLDAGASAVSIAGVIGSSCAPWTCTGGGLDGSASNTFTLQSTDVGPIGSNPWTVSQNWLGNGERTDTWQIQSDNNPPAANGDATWDGTTLTVYSQGFGAVGGTMTSPMLAEVLDTSTGVTYWGVITGSGSDVPISNWLSTPPFGTSDSLTITWYYPITVDVTSGFTDGTPVVDQVDLLDATGTSGQLGITGASTTVDETFGATSDQVQADVQAAQGSGTASVTQVYSSPGENAYLITWTDGSMPTLSAGNVSLSGQVTVTQSVLQAGSGSGGSGSQSIFASPIFGPFGTVNA